MLHFTENMVNKPILFVVLMTCAQSKLRTNPCHQAIAILRNLTECSCVPRGGNVEIKCVNRGSGNFNPIPEMPNNMSHLYVQGYQLSNISKETFKNLVDIKLYRITLLDNSIVNISKDAFSEMKHLSQLEISKEIQVSKHEISEMFFMMSRKIKSLRFSHNTWDHPPSFRGLKNASVTELILSYNYFRSLEGDWFSDLPKLHTLDVSFNGITENEYNFSGLGNITNLFLSGNWFKDFPNFCPYKSWNLSRLHFQYNKLTEFKPSYFQCLPHLTHLNMNGHAIRRLYNNTFTNLTSLRELKIQRLAGQLFRIEERAFESESLNRLVFTNNDFVFRNSSPDSAFEFFKYCPSLTDLDISSNNIQLNEEEFIGMISPLKNLTKLGLMNTRLFFLPRKLLAKLPLLETLNASENYLNGSWDGMSVFGNATTLKQLNLSDNNIEKITEFNFPLTLLNGIRKNGLDLSYNRFSCNCEDALWFYRWMHSNKEKLANLTTIVCQINVPVHTSTSNLFDLTERDLCPINPAIFIAIIASCSVILGVFIVFAVVYKLRWNIRHWLYVITYKNKGYDTMSDDPDFKYDIFLVYADEDRVFIFDTVVPYLEAKAYSLCVRCRDFEVGKLHCDNIVDNMNLSRRILLVLSNNFANSKWCEFQMNFAYNRCMDEKINNIVVAVLEEISFKYLSNTLKVLLTSYDYALWSKCDETGQTLFWEKVLRKLQFRMNHTECANEMITAIQ